MGGITGGFVCTVVAELTLPPRLKEDPACASCGVTASMDQERDGGARSVLRVVGGQDATQVGEERDRVGGSEWKSEEEREVQPIYP